jgi:hypothetical protein
MSIAPMASRATSRGSCLCASKTSWSDSRQAAVVDPIWIRSRKDTTVRYDRLRI